MRPNLLPGPHETRAALVGLGEGVEMRELAPYRVVDIANYVVSKCYRDGKPVSNLQLQKMLYFLQLLFLEAFKVPLFNEEFEAWPYGPVMPSVYRMFSRFGGAPIDMSVDGAGRLVLRDHKGFLDVAIEVLREKSPWDLVRVSHADNSPWDIVYNQQGRHKGVIPNDMLFESIAAHAHA